VDGQMGLCNDHHAADPEGAKVVKMGLNDGGFCCFGCCDQNLFDLFKVIEKFGVAFSQLHEQMHS